MLAAVLWTLGAGESPGGVARWGAAESPGSVDFAPSAVSRDNAAADRIAERPFAASSERAEVEHRAASGPNSRVARFLAIDAKTSQPVERYGLTLVAELSDALMSRPPEKPHPGGTCELDVSNDLVGYHIAAFGYAPQEGELALDCRDGGFQTIRLERGGSIAGRITLGGAPQASASVSISRADLGAPSSPPTYDVSAFLAAPRSSPAARDGAFRFEDLAAGTYALGIRADHGARREIDRIRVEPNAHVDLGEIALVRGPIVRGVVLLPNNAPAAGVNVLAKCGGESRIVPCDPTGSFEIDGPPAGHWTIAARDLPDVVADAREVVLDLAEGEERDVVLDFRDATGVWLVVRVQADGAPLRGAQVTVEFLTAKWGNRDLTPTDGDGVTRRWCRRLQSVAVVARTSRGMPLARVERDLGAEGETVVEIDVRTARLASIARG